MPPIDNVHKLWRDDLASTIQKGSKISLAASCFSIYAFQELREALRGIQEMRFIFTSPTFVTERANKEQREFYIPRLNRERSLTGSEFEIQQERVELQRQIAKLEGKIRRERSIGRKMELRAELNRMRSKMRD